MLYLCLGHCWLSYQCKNVEDYAKNVKSSQFWPFFRTVSSYTAFRLQQKFKTVIKNFNLRGRGALRTLRDKR